LAGSKNRVDRGERRKMKIFIEVDFASTLETGRHAGGCLLISDEGPFRANNERELGK
jgi:hypothetical protein